MSNVNKFPQLHIFLGAGGVGKTTLSAAYALALAQEGNKVGLLSIDPAKRLQSALQTELSDEGARIKLPDDKGFLLASMLQMDHALRRWVQEQNLSEVKKQRLFENPYFQALSDKLASSVDTLAAIRIAEWVEQYPDLDHLVIDTAPGIHAVDFITKPEKLSLFLDSKLVDWLKSSTEDSQPKKRSFFNQLLKSGARKILDGLSVIGGQNFIVNFGDFLILLDDILIQAMKRLNYSRQWIFHESTKIILVCSVRDDASHVARQLAQVLSKFALTPDLSIINKVLPDEIIQSKELDFLLATSYEKNSLEDVLSNYISSYARTQAKVLCDLQMFSKNVIKIPNSENLDKDYVLRIDDLISLGQKIKSLQKVKKT